MARNSWLNNEVCSVTVLKKRGYALMVIGRTSRNISTNDLLKYRVFLRNDDLKRQKLQCNMFTA